jgi:hypothetical protein
MASVAGGRRGISNLNCSACPLRARTSAESDSANGAAGEAHGPPSDSLLHRASMAEAAWTKRKGAGSLTAGELQRPRFGHPQIRKAGALLSAAGQKRSVDCPRAAEGIRRGINHPPLLSSARTTPSTFEREVHAWSKRAKTHRVGSGVPCSAVKLSVERHHRPPLGTRSCRGR